MFDSQKVLLRGVEARCSLLTETLRRVKDQGGISSGTALLLAFKEWENLESVPNQQLEKRRWCGTVRVVQLPLMFSSPKEQAELNVHLDTIRRDVCMKTVLRPLEVPREQWLLEALIVLLAHFLSSPTLAAFTTIQSADGIKARKLGPQSLGVTCDKAQGRQSWVLSASELDPNENNKNYNIISNNITIGSNLMTSQDQVALSSSPKKKTGWRKMMKEFERENSCPPSEARSSHGTHHNEPQRDEPRSRRESRSTRESSVFNSRFAGDDSDCGRIRREPSVYSSRTCRETSVYSSRTCRETSVYTPRASRESSVYTSRASRESSLYTSSNSKEFSVFNPGTSTEQPAYNPRTSREPRRAIRECSAYAQRNTRDSSAEYSPGATRDTSMLNSRFSSSCNKPDGRQSSRPNKQTRNISSLRNKYCIESGQYPALSRAERRRRAESLSTYLAVIPPEERELPGFPGLHGKWERHGLGVDCDEVWPGILLGNGATVKKLKYLRDVGVTAVLNAAEFRGVNVGVEYFTDFEYTGVRIEDTPQTQICRHFLDVVEFMDSVLINQGKLFVNCVFGKSRSATFVAVYLMIKNDWSALRALKHIRQFRPVQVNEGFLHQLVNLDYKLNLAMEEGRAPKAERRASKGEGRTLYEERRTSKGEGRIICNERRTSKGEGRTLWEERRTSKGESRTLCEERRASKGEGRTQCEERRTSKGEVRTLCEERRASKGEGRIQCEERRVSREEGRIPRERGRVVKEEGRTSEIDSEPER